MAGQNKHTVFDQIEFPSYEFREFPMAVPVNADGTVADSPYDDRNKSRPIVTVNSQAELDALKGPDVTLIEVSPGNSRVQSEADLRAALYEQADPRGVKIDKAWSVERIEKALQAASDEVV